MFGTVVQAGATLDPMKIAGSSARTAPCAAVTTSLPGSLCSSWSLRHLLGAARLQVLRGSHRVAGDDVRRGDDARVAGAGDTVLITSLSLAVRALCAGATLPTLARPPTLCAARPPVATPYRRPQCRDAPAPFDSRMLSRVLELL